MKATAKAVVEAAIRDKQITDVLFGGCIVDGPDYDSLECALASIGVFVYPDPRCDGSSSQGLIFSKIELTRKQIQEYVKEN